VDQIVVGGDLPGDVEIVNYEVGVDWVPFRLDGRKIDSFYLGCWETLGDISLVCEY
jgi:hypothetical protein